MDSPAWEHADRAVSVPYFRSLERLGEAQGELAAEGVQLKDVDQALIDFPARHQGRTVLLCWREGEDGIGWFHEVDAGFAGRQPISELEPDPL